MSNYKNVVLIFSLVTTAFLSSYKNIVLIFALVKNDFVFLIFKKVRNALLNCSEGAFMLVYCPGNYKTQRMCN